MITVKFLVDFVDVTVEDGVVDVDVVAGVTGLITNEAALSVTCRPDGKLTLKLPDSTTLCRRAKAFWKSSGVCPFSGTNMKDT